MSRQTMTTTESAASKRQISNANAFNDLLALLPRSDFVDGVLGAYHPDSVLQGAPISEYDEMFYLQSNYFPTGAIIWRRSGYEWARVRILRNNQEWNTDQYREIEQAVIEAAQTVTGLLLSGGAIIGTEMPDSERDNPLSKAVKLQTPSDIYTILDLLKDAGYQFDEGEKMHLVIINDTVLMILKVMGIDLDASFVRGEPLYLLMPGIYRDSKMLRGNATLQRLLRETIFSVLKRPCFDREIPIRYFSKDRSAVINQYIYEHACNMILYQLINDIDNLGRGFNANRAKLRNKIRDWLSRFERQHRR